MSEWGGASMQPSEIVRGDIMLEWSGKHPTTIERERGKERAPLIGFPLKGPTETFRSLGRSVGGA